MYEDLYIFSVFPFEKAELKKQVVCLLSYKILLDFKHITCLFLYPKSYYFIYFSASSQVKENCSIKCFFVSSSLTLNF